MTLFCISCDSAVAHGDDDGTKGHVGVTLLSINATLSGRNLSKAIRY